MRPQALFFIVFLPLFLSCRTTTVDGLSPLQADFYKTVIKHACFFEGKGNFAAQVSSTSIPSITWEGKWSKNFTQLKTQLVDPTGRVLNNNPFTQIEDKFGARGLRGVMCGQTAFSPFIMIEDHKIKVKSQIGIVSLQNNETVLETKSEFYYGLFSKKSQVTLVWKGRIKDGKVTPLSINFGSADELVSINFLDYE